MNDGYIHIKNGEKHKDPCLDQYHNIDKLEITKVFHYYAEGYDRILENLELVTKVANKLSVIQQVWDLSGMMGAVISNKASIETASNNIDSIKNVSNILNEVINVANNNGNINTVVENLDLINSIKDDLSAIRALNDIIGAINIVASRKDEIEELYANINNLSEIFDNLDNINVIHANLAAVIAVAKYLKKLLDLHNNIENIINIVTNIDIIKNINNNLDDLIRLSQFDMDEIEAKINEIRALIDELKNTNVSVLPIKTDAIKEIKPTSSNGFTNIIFENNIKFNDNIDISFDSDCNYVKQGELGMIVSGQRGHSKIISNVYLKTLEPIDTPEEAKTIEFPKIRILQEDEIISLAQEKVAISNEKGFTIKNGSYSSSILMFNSVNGLCSFDFKTFNNPVGFPSDTQWNKLPSLQYMNEKYYIKEEIDEKISNINSSNGEENVINSISVNGVAADIVNKNVDIIIPEGNYDDSALVGRISSLETNFINKNFYIANLNGFHLANENNGYNGRYRLVMSSLEHTKDDNKQTNSFGFAEFLEGEKAGQLAFVRMAFEYFDNNVKQTKQINLVHLDMLNDFYKKSEVDNLVNNGSGASLSINALSNPGGEEIKSTITQGDNSTELSYQKNMNGELPNYINARVNDDSFMIPTTGYIESKISQSNTVGFANLFISPDILLNNRFKTSSVYNSSGEVYNIVASTLFDFISSSGLFHIDTQMTATFPSSCFFIAPQIVVNVEEKDIVVPSDYDSNNGNSKEYYDYPQYFKEVVANWELVFADGSKKSGVIANKCFISTIQTRYATHAIGGNGVYIDTGVEADYSHILKATGNVNKSTGILIGAYNSNSERVTTRIQPTSNKVQNMRPGNHDIELDVNTIDVKKDFSYSSTYGHIVVAQNGNSKTYIVPATVTNNRSGSFGINYYLFSESTTNSYTGSVSLSEAIIETQDGSKLKHFKPVRIGNNSQKMIIMDISAFSDDMQYEFFQELDRLDSLGLFDDLDMTNIKEKILNNIGISNPTRRSLFINSIYEPIGGTIGYVEMAIA